MNISAIDFLLLLTKTIICDQKGLKNVSFEYDSAVRRMVARFGLHQCFGPSPSVHMLI
jgi:hypothetical protein